MGACLAIDEAYLPATLTASPMSDEAFIEFCSQFPDCFVEMSADGEILIMPPSDYFTSAQVGHIFRQLAAWSEARGDGWATESSGGFVLPNGARRAPDIAWFPAGALVGTRRRPGFPHFAPAFVVELRSPSDRLSRLRPKMREWVENGAELAWLVDPERRVVEIYRPGAEPELLTNPQNISGDGPVAGFVLDLRRVWEPGPANPVKA